MAFPILFVWFLIGIFIFRHHLRKNSKIEDAAHDAFWKKEASSLVVRKRDLEPNDYIQTSLSEKYMKDQTFFDGIQAPDLYRQQMYLFDLSQKPMVNFQNLDNADVRLQFGTATITAVEAYENNYVQYIKTLFLLAKGLIAVGQEDLAKHYLEEGIAVDTDIRGNYTLLATIYKQHQQEKALTNLYERAMNLNTLTKNQLIKELDQIRLGKDINQNPLPY
ncbi:hypothetical protein [Petrocella sp. FN5]|uniref:hypothetical protein n=1 Tax=Petrocella sp. FN5 TaxID=3032002 RepID=UPI0023D97AE9|nr:hypothetical protein [Petrocella sp. FN5]MDF1616488.1 hypothetical protein [Petrocella sp. FN5]